MQQRTVISEWLAEVLNKTGWSANQWAKLAKVSPTTITRFLKRPESAPIPGTATLGKLSSAVPARFKIAPLQIIPEDKASDKPIADSPLISRLIEVTQNLSDDGIRAMIDHAEGLQLLQEKLK